jgi:hypothetical protein
MARIVLLRHAGFHTKLARVNVSNRYQHLYETWQYANGCSEQLSYQAFIRQILDKTDALREADDFCEQLECALFSGDEPETSQYDYIVNQLELYRRKLVKNMKYFKRVGYFAVRGLW